MFNGCPISQLSWNPTTRAAHFLCFYLFPLYIFSNNEATVSTSNNANNDKVTIPSLRCMGLVNLLLQLLPSTHFHMHFQVACNKKQEWNFGK